MTRADKIKAVLANGVEFVLAYFGKRRQMRGHNTKHQHIHTNADVLWVCCHRLLSEIHDRTTPEGLENAEECYQEQLLKQPNADPSSLLAGKIWSILDAAKKGIPIA